MEIYQIHQYSGEGEDYSDRIVGSYMDEKKAEERKEKLEEKEKNEKKCGSCPLYYCQDNCDGNCDTCMDNAREEVAKNCPNYKSKAVGLCANFHLTKESSFKIKKEYVIE